MGRNRYVCVLDLVHIVVYGSLICGAFQLAVLLGVMSLIEDSTVPLVKDHVDGFLCFIIYRVRRDIILLIVKHQVLSHLTATSICPRFPFSDLLSFNTTLSVLCDISHINVLHYADHVILCGVAIHGLCCLTIIYAFP